jgi:leucyl/phenylalanyl-tRNA--protein transferase
MAHPNGELAWYSPDPRGVLPLLEFHIPHGTRRALKSSKFQVRVNTAFDDVMNGCASRRETWIDGRIKRSYAALHKIGYAHSVETWLEDRLVGGLYGVSLGGVFFGESMFHRVTDASKVALAWLVARLKIGGFELLDCQFMTDHLASLGAIEITQGAYLKLLESALTKPVQPSSGLASSLDGVAGSAGAAWGVLDGALSVGAGASSSDGFSSIGVSSPGKLILQLLTQTS